MNNKRNTILIISALVVIGLIALAIALLNNDDVSNKSTGTSSSQQSQSGETKVSTYTDGTYAADGRYLSPGGGESIRVEVQLRDNIIVASEVKGDATSSEGKEYQQRFISNYKDMVVGKNIDEVSLTRVAGSSLTSNGFNDALESIREDARQ